MRWYAAGQGVRLGARRSGRTPRVDWATESLPSLLSDTTSVGGSHSLWILPPPVRIQGPVSRTYLDADKKPALSGLLRQPRQSFAHTMQRVPIRECDEERVVAGN